MPNPDLAAVLFVSQDGRRPRGDRPSPVPSLSDSGDTASEPNPRSSPTGADGEAISPKPDAVSLPTEQSTEHTESDTPKSTESTTESDEPPKSTTESDGPPKSATESDGSPESATESDAPVPSAGDYIAFSKAVYAGEVGEVDEVAAEVAAQFPGTALLDTLRTRLAAFMSDAEVRRALAMLSDPGLYATVVSSKADAEGLLKIAYLPEYTRSRAAIAHRDADKFNQLWVQTSADLSRLGQVAATAIPAPRAAAPAAFAHASPPTTKKKKRRPAATDSDDSDGDDGVRGVRGAKKSRGSLVLARAVIQANLEARGDGPPDASLDGMDLAIMRALYSAVLDLIRRTEAGERALVEFDVTDPQKAAPAHAMAEAEMEARRRAKARNESRPHGFLPKAAMNVVLVKPSPPHAGGGGSSAGFSVRIVHEMLDLNNPDGPRILADRVARGGDLFSEGLEEGTLITLDAVDESLISSLSVRLPDPAAVVKALQRCYIFMHNPFLMSATPLAGCVVPPGESAEFRGFVDSVKGRLQARCERQWSAHGDYKRMGETVLNMCFPSMSAQWKCALRRLPPPPIAVN